MSVERPFLQAPYESLHLNFRHTRQILDQALSDLYAELGDSQGELSEARAAKLHARVAQLKAKVAECRQTHLRHAKTLKVRAEQVAAVSQAVAQGNESQATDDSVLTLVASYLADLGLFPRTLEALVERQPQLQHLVDWDVIAEENRFVETVVRHKDYRSGLKWCRQNRSFLSKHGIDLEFRLQMLQYEHLLMDKGDVLGAITYARKAFAKAGPAKDCVLLRAAGALYGPVKVYAREPAVASSPLDSDSSGEVSDAALEKVLREAFRSVHGRGQAYTLLSRVGVGLAVLKTRQCGKLPAPPGHKNCPACLPSLEPIVEQVPYAMHTTSILDEDVVVLPNNHIIGLKDLKDYTKEHWPDEAERGVLVDPENGDRFSEDDFDSVYPL